MYIKNEENMWKCQIKTKTKLTITYLLKIFFKFYRRLDSVS